MRLLAGCIILATLSLATAGGQSAAVIDSIYSRQDNRPTADPRARFWHDIPGIVMENDSFGVPVPGHRTEIRSRWTKQALYLLFECPYEAFWLKPEFDIRHETNRLWNWDVAEAFLGDDFQHINHYREFEVSPRGEWVDLDIDLSKPNHEDGWTWNSGFVAATRIDARSRTWYAEMRIPWRALIVSLPEVGTWLRANFYRAQGPPPGRNFLAWQATRTKTFHAPEVFGTLRLTNEAGGE